MSPRIAAWIAALLLPGLLGCGSEPLPPRTPPRGVARHLLAIEHHDQMSDSFQLIGAAFFLDDQEVFRRAVRETDDAEPIATPLCVFRELVAAGTHELRVELRYRGNGHGIFSYLREYRFDVTGASDVEVPAGAVGVIVRTIGHERGGVTTPLSDRPKIRFVVEPLHDPEQACRPGEAPASPLTLGLATGNVCMELQELVAGIATPEVG